MATEEPMAKKAKVDEGTSEVDESRDFDTETQKALEEVDSCQNELDALNEKASEEILQVEQKFNKLRKPHYERRNDAIQKISNFWMTAFINHPQISAVLAEEEEECLQYLTKVEVEEFEDIKSGYRIKMHFKGNPFFENDALIKEFHLATSGDPASQSQPIKWKEGQNLIDRAEKRQAAQGRKRKMGSIRTFFQWYMDNSEPATDDIAEVIKDDMWPNPLQYFLATDLDGEENGVHSDEDDDEEGDESVVVMDEEDDDDEGLDDEEGVEEVDDEYVEDLDGEEEEGEEEDTGGA